MRRFSGSWVSRGSWAALVTVAMTATGQAGGLSADGHTDGGVVGGLSVMADLEPLAEIAALQQGTILTDISVGKAFAKTDTQLRSSVPALNRAQSYAPSEVFANSKAVMPLLVSDIEPVVVAVSRPLSGRSVGARPSLSFAKPLTRISAK
jgi:hypothetical protein